MHQPSPPKRPPPLRLEPPPTARQAGAKASQSQRLRRSTERLLGQVAGADDLAGRWPETLISIAAILDAALRGAAPDADRAELARRCTVALADYIGGRKLYLPDAGAVRRALRDAAIWRAFDGRNVAELARRYKLSLNQVYIILRVQRALHRRPLPPRP